MWTDYTGKLGKNDIQLSLYAFEDGRVFGNYRLYSDAKNIIQLKGKSDSCTIHAAAYNAINEVQGSFTLHIFLDKAAKKDKTDGEYIAADNTRSDVRLFLSAMVAGTPEQRYDFLFGTTGEVEDFAATIKTSFINNDKDWLAGHGKYPLTVYVDKGRNKVIKKKKDFLDSYVKLFSKAFINKFKIHCFNMFSNHVGAAMGKGKVYINHTDNSIKEKYEYYITAINVALKILHFLVTPLPR